MRTLLAMPIMQKIQQVIGKKLKNYIIMNYREEIKHLEDLHEKLAKQ